MIFSRAPLLLVTGDGRVITEGPVPAIYPGPLLPNLVERTITEDGVQTLLAKADELGLLADVEYAGIDQIADAPDTVVRITVDGTTYTHSAYALGFEGETDAGRANLFEFVTAATDLAGTVGESELGPEGPMASDTYLMRATPVDLGHGDHRRSRRRSSTGPPTRRCASPTRPSAPSCRRPRATRCSPTPPSSRSSPRTGSTYQVAATPAVPGRSC